MKSIYKKNILSFYQKSTLGFIFLTIVTIRFVEYRIGNTNLLIIEPFFLLFFSLYIIDKLISKLNSKRKLLVKYFLFFIIYGLISAVISYFVYSNEPASILGKLRQICIYPLVFFLSYDACKSDYFLKKLHHLMIIAILLFYPLSLFSFILGLNVFERHGYFQLFYHWEGWIATYLFFYYILSFLSGKKIKVRAFIHIILSVIIIILTVRRGLWLSTFGGFLILYKISNFRFSFKNKVKFVMVFSFIFLVLFFSTLDLESNQTFIGQNVISSLTNRFVDMIANLDAPTSAQSGGTAYLRIIRYQDGINTFLAYPIFGKGIGYKSQFMIPNSSSWRYVQSLFHNSYLEVLVSMGIIGLFLFLLIHYKFLIYVHENKRILNTETYLIIFSLMGIYYTGMLWSVVDNTFVSNSNFIFFLYSIMGIVTRTVRNNAN